MCVCVQETILVGLGLAFGPIGCGYSKNSEHPNLPMRQAQRDDPYARGGLYTSG